MQRLFFYLFFTCCLSAEAAPPKIFNVAALYWSMKIEGQVAMRKGFEEEIDAYNKAHEVKIKVTPYVAGEGRSGLLNQIEELNTAVHSKPDAIVLQPADVTILTKGVQDANSMNIPVFIYDQYVLNAKITSYVTSDNYQAGWDNGLYIDSLFPAGKALKIVPFEYFRVSATVDRMDGFFDALRSKNRNFTVLGHYEAVEPEGGRKAAKQFLKDFPKKNSVDAIFTNNDGGGLAVVKELWEKGRREIQVATVDGDPVSIENIKAKKLTVIDSAQFCGELGRGIARNMIAYLTTGSAPPVQFIPTFPVTLASLHNYPGWMGRPVEKPRTQSIRDLNIKSKENSKNHDKEVVIKVGLSPYCPYLCDLGPAGWGGYLSDILQSLAKDKKLKIEIVSLPSEKLLPALANHQVNYVVSPVSRVRYQPEIRIVGPKLGMSSVGAVFTPGFKLRLVDTESLSDKRIVFAQLGHENQLQLPQSDFNKSLKFTGGDPADRMTKLIAERRVDLALGDYNVLRYTLLRHQLLSLEVQPTSLTGYNAMVLVASPKEPDMGNLPFLLESWFVENRASGKLEKILKKYNLNDWGIFAL